MKASVCHSRKGWVVDAFRKRGVAYKAHPDNRSAIYLNCLPLFTAGRSRLINDDRIVAQFCGLERRVLISGREEVNHSRASHDDVANAVAGALVLADPRNGDWFGNIDDTCMVRSSLTATQDRHQARRVDSAQTVASLRVGYSPRPAAAPQSQPSAKLEPFVAQPINDAGPSHNRGGLRFPAEPRRASDFRVPNNMDRVLARSRTHSGYPRSFFGGGNQP